MFRKYVYNKITWLDFKNPMSSEVKDATKKYNISEETLRSFMSEQSQTNAYISDEIIFLSLPFPIISEENSSKKTSSSHIRFIIGSNYILTARNINSKAFRYVSKRIKKDINTNSINSSETSSLDPMSAILVRLYEEIGNDLEKLQLELLEAKDLYAGHKNSHDEILMSQREVWVTFDSLCQTFFDNPSSGLPIEKIISSYKNTHSKIRSQVSIKKDNKISRKKRFWIF